MNRASNAGLREKRFAHEALLAQAARSSHIALAEKEQAALQVEHPANALFVTQGTQGEAAQLGR